MMNFKSRLATLVLGSLLQYLRLLILFTFQGEASAERSGAPLAISSQSPNEPAGRLASRAPSLCPVPGRIGILSDDPLNNSISWAFPPRCVSAAAAPQDHKTPRLDCLFTSATFRNGQGTSLITTPTTVSHLIGIGAFQDKPSSPAPQHRHSEPAYEFVTSQATGTGVAATRGIHRGEIIMTDIPTLFIDISFLAATKPHHRRRLIKQAISQLPRQTQKSLYRLYRDSSEYEVEAILGSNSHTVTVADSVPHIGLFTEAARINHSCRPNAYYRFSESRLTMEVIAYHAIEPGDEIFISYVPLETPAETRRQYLRDHWGFDCSCSLCRGPETDVADSESWRRKIKSLKETIVNAKIEGFYQDAIVMAEEWLMFAEWDRQPPLMPEYDGLLAELYHLKGDVANATRYARMAVDGWARLGSVDDKELEQARLFLSQLER